MSTKKLTIGNQPMLPNSKKNLVLLTTVLIFSLHIPILCTEWEEDSSGRTSKRDSKCLKITHPDDNKGLKSIRVQEEKSQYATEEDIELVRGKLTQNKKTPSNNYFWNILFRQKRAGKVSIDLKDEPPFGSHASMQIFLNKTAQGKHIGRIAYLRACTLSHYDVVYASMRKNNVASYRAAQAAGFQEIKNKAFMQRVMKWVR